MLHVDLIRLLAAAILFILTLIFGTLPIYILEFTSKYIKKKEQVPNLNLVKSKWPRWFQHDHIVQFLSQVGGGVLFYTAFVHMLPEIREHYETYLKIENKTLPIVNIGSDNSNEDSDDVFPLVDMCACAGLFGIFLLEEVMHGLLGGHHHSNHGHPHHHHHINHDHYYERGECRILKKSAPNNRRRTSLRHCIDKLQKYDPQINDDECSITNPIEEQQQQQQTTTKELSPSKKQSGFELSSGFSETHPISSNQQQTLCYNTCQQQCSHHQSSDLENFQNTLVTSNSDMEDNRIPKWPYIVENFLLILAFSCHSIFDGISIGVQSNEINTWTMLIAILSHKLLIAFILSFQVYEKCQHKIIDPASLKLVLRPIKGAKIILWFFSTLFALMSPFGIIIVMILNDSLSTPSETSLQVIILAAVSAGTILYIVFFEIVNKFGSRIYINGIVQWVALSIGFAAMHFISKLFHD